MSKEQKDVGLPGAPQEVGPAGPVAAAEPKPRVLVVDSEPETIRGIGCFLEKNGFEVTAIGQHDHLVNMLCRRCFDLVLMEVTGPVPKGSSQATREEMEFGRSTGLVILKQIRQKNPGLAIPPVVLLTVVCRGLLDGLEEAGVVAAINKPVEKEELLAAIRAALALLKTK